MSMRRQFLFIAIATLIGFVSLAPPVVADATRPAILEARVSKIIDGDTFTLSGHSRRIRVWGLDAPEWNRPGGSDATAALRGLISGKTLRCQVRDIDRYGRYVGQCFLPDGRDITAEMIQMGVAREYCRFSRNHYGSC